MEMYFGNHAQYAEDANYRNEDIVNVWSRHRIGYVLVGRGESVIDRRERWRMAFSEKSWPIRLCGEPELRLTGYRPNWEFAALYHGLGGRSRKFANVSYGEIYELLPEDRIRSKRECEIHSFDFETTDSALLGVTPLVGSVSKEMAFAGERSLRIEAKGLMGFEAPLTPSYDLADTDLLTVSMRAFAKQLRRGSIEVRI
jgi:hypothetical protein